MGRKRRKAEAESWKEAVGKEDSCNTLINEIESQWGKESESRIWAGLLQKELQVDITPGADANLPILAFTHGTQVQRATR